MAGTIELKEIYEQSYDDSQLPDANDTILLGLKYDESNNKKFVSSYIGQTVLSAISDSASKWDSTVDNISNIENSLTTETETRKTEDTKLSDNIAECVTDINLLKEHFCDIGEFTSEEAALNALASAQYAGNNNYAVLYAKYGDNGHFVCIQNFATQDYGSYLPFTRQFLFNKNAIFQRCVTFTDTTRTSVQSTDAFEFAIMDRLSWDANERKLVPSLFGNTFNKQYTAAIPLSSNTAAGLMSAEQAQKLADLEQRVAVLEAKA